MGRCANATVYYGSVITKEQYKLFLTKEQIEEFDDGDSSDCYIDIEEKGVYTIYKEDEENEYVIGRRLLFAYDGIEKIPTCEDLINKTKAIVTKLSSSVDIELDPPTYLVIPQYD